MTSRKICAAIGLTLALSATCPALAQSVTVTFSSQKQYIRGYGGMTHAAWAGDMTAAERTLAFGNAAGQLGFSILRLPVTDGNPDSVNVATAKAAIANGGIVIASPWNAAGTYTSGQFASYLTHLNNFVSYMKNQGVDLYAISVQNEPDYGAQSGWGSWTAASCHDFVLNYGSKVTTKLISCESFNYAKSYFDPILNDPAALANVAILGTHLYGTAVSAYAYPLFDSKGAGKELWMTEHYTDSTTDANSWPNALGVASEVHNAMVTGQFNAYIWWYIKRSYGFINNGAVTKRGWCIAHWSKFVRPGFHRVDATASPTAGVSLSAFKGDSSSVIVLVNTNSSSKSLTISIPGATVAAFSKYTTSSSKSLASEGSVTASNGSLSVALDASSVTTLVASGSNGTGGNTGTGGTSSMGGSAGAGGTPSGGSPGAGGGATVGGTATAAGSPGAGGTATMGGTATAAGSPGAGGARNTGGTGAIGGSAITGGSSARGGAPQSSGGSSTGAGGEAKGGALSTGGSVSSSGGGNGGRGGSATSGGLSASSGGIVSESNGSGDGSCSCRVAGRGSNSNALVALSVLGALALGARRREGKKLSSNAATRAGLKA